MASKKAHFPAMLVKSDRFTQQRGPMPQTSHLGNRMYTFVPHRAWLSSTRNNYRGRGQTFNSNSFPHPRRPQYNQFYNRRGTGVFTTYHPSRVDFPSTRPDKA
ncbi:hypothetical protein PoB_002309300 [Plakobranchus ocellatus]|uniref:Uncharacterized protein n=1 Tax=Plakobranchus ocellatus TaxID=259542 RepID=A0AAV3ZP28_9GAST|nr:hypothetical protein PoB_002309300 [Plakobranchus ocellatus]